MDYSYCGYHCSEDPIPSVKVMTCVQADGSDATTIQAAIDNPDCKDGDTIKVLPGIYDQGCHEESDKNGNVLTRSRVYIDKRVNIIATGSKDETHIVGRFCPVEEGGDATYATGPTAVRCIRVPASGNGSTLTSFTIRDSATTGGTSTSVYYNFPN